MCMVGGVGKQMETVRFRRREINHFSSLVHVHCIADMGQELVCQAYAKHECHNLMSSQS